MTTRRKCPDRRILLHLYHDFGMTGIALAEMFDVSTGTIYKYLNHYAARNKCVDCGAPIHKRSTRCKGCQAKKLGEENRLYPLRAIICQQCGFEFESSASNGTYRKYCSAECAIEATKKFRIIKTCPNCGEEFETLETEDRIYCSGECYLNFVHENAHSTASCEVCGREFEYRITSASTGKYCSHECSMIARRIERTSTICVMCGREFGSYLPSDRPRMYCSDECRRKWRSEYAASRTGPLSPSWRGGISYEPYGPEFNDELKEVIRERDGYSCAICRLYGKNVHHIDYVKTNNNPFNLITLCTRCHMTTNYNRDYWQQELSALVLARTR